MPSFSFCLMLGYKPFTQGRKMLDQKNIPGEFPIEIAGEEYIAKCNFGVIEKLERQILKRSLMSLMTDAANWNASICDMVDVVTAAIEAGGNKIDRMDVGNHIQKIGIKSHLEWHIAYLSYAITGDETPEFETSEKTSDSKKKSS